MLRPLLCCTAAVLAPMGFGTAPRAILPDLPRQEADDCAFEAERSAVLGASGVNLLDLAHESGSLVVEGRAGLTEVRVRVRACASHREYLDGLQVEADRSGSTARVRGLYPRLGNQGWNENRYARLDMVVEVPAGLAADIEDGSGAMELLALGPLNVEDGSGSMTISDARGEVRIDDGSGSVSVDGVRGDLHLDDGSGSVDITGVEGDVNVEDGSGDIQVSRAAGHVVLRDGSGSIDVRDVGGDFRVLEDGSGSIRHTGVRGVVDIPSRDRRRGGARQH